MCTIAFEGFQLNCERRPSTLPDITATSQLQVSFYDILSYGYCYCGLMTGPYYRFATYVDMLQQSKQIPSFQIALQRLKYLPLLIAIYLPLNIYFPVSHLTSSEYLNHTWGIIYQLAYLAPLFTWFRWRFYIGWLLAESSCISLALGAYPEECKSRPGQGPTLQLTEDQKEIGNIKYEYDNNTHDQVALIYYFIGFNPGYTRLCLVLMRKNFPMNNIVSLIN